MNFCKIDMLPAYINFYNEYKSEIDNKIHETPEIKLTKFGHDTCKHMYMHSNETNLKQVYMRLALNLRINDLTAAFHIFDDLCAQLYVHATPTLSNIGKNIQQLSSCFLLSPHDSINSITSVASDAIRLSQKSGGIGICVTNIRGKDSVISTSNSKSQGVYGFLRLYEASQDCSSQGGKRPGAYAIYISPFHSDIEDVIDAAKIDNSIFATEHKNLPNLKFALMLEDKFMDILHKVVTNKSIEYLYLFDPGTYPNLFKLYGKKFSNEYDRLVTAKDYTKKIVFNTLYISICECISQRGFPYLLSKGNINRQSNCQHYGTIMMSNLCAEITTPSICYEQKVNTRDIIRELSQDVDICQHTKHLTDYINDIQTRDEYGVCNLASINLPKHITHDNKIDWVKLMSTTSSLVYNLNKVIDISHKPNVPVRNGDLKHRAIGIGIVGLAGLFYKLRLNYDSIQAVQISMNISAVIYYAAMKTSSELGKKHGNYESFNGSPTSRGLLQPDLYLNSLNENFLQLDNRIHSHIHKFPRNWEHIIQKETDGLISVADWDLLRINCSKHLRNAYVTASPPTATCSVILNENECFEPVTFNIYTRKTLNGEYIIENKYLIAELKDIGMWNDNIRQQIINNAGSIQNINGIPNDIKSRYKTSREILDEWITTHGIMSQAFTTQSRSINRFYTKITTTDLTTMMLDSYTNGLTTLSYYCHSTPPIGGAVLNNNIKKNDDHCEMCVV